MSPRPGWSTNRETRANPSDCRVVLLSDPGGFTSLDAWDSSPTPAAVTITGDCQDGGVSRSRGGGRGHSPVNGVHGAKAERWTIDGNHRP